MSRIFLNLDERLRFLEQDNMALRCVFHLNITEAMLLQKKRKEDDGYSESKGLTERQEDIAATDGSKKGHFLDLAKLNILETIIFDAPQYNSSDSSQDLLQQ